MRSKANWRRHFHSSISTFSRQYRRHSKVRNEYHVYMTDAQGRVVFDSAGLAVGKDYSRWNDVWLTLRGNTGHVVPRAVRVIQRAR
jgi:hypothetical protein